MKIEEEIDMGTEFDYGFNAHPNEFIEFLQSKINLIPEEFRDSAVLDITAFNYGLCIALDYIRPETAQEKQNKLTEIERIAEANKDKELKMLAALQAKYGK